MVNFIDNNIEILLIVPCIIGLVFAIKRYSNFDNTTDTTIANLTNTLQVNRHYIEEAHYDLNDHIACIARDIDHGSSFSQVDTVEALNSYINYLNVMTADAIDPDIVPYELILSCLGLLLS